MLIALSTDRPLWRHRWRWLCGVLAQIAKRSRQPRLKDSWDANIHRDGQVAIPPIALCEVQGYVYDAKYRMATLLEMFGDLERARKCRRDADELARRFDETYWNAERGFYAMALDADKSPLEVIASNPGHLLWSRIINRERAKVVTQRMMQDDMFSGWGWRTMHSRNKSLIHLAIIVARCGRMTIR